MQIAICDDDQTFRNEIEDFLTEYKRKHLLCIDTFEFSTGRELLESEESFDMVFLDYQMPGIDGLDTARKLRKRNNVCSIVFVTNYPDFVYDSFEVNPYRFFPKPVDKNKLNNLMNSFIAHQKSLAPIIVINDGERFVIESKKILYLKGDGKYCKIITRSHIYSSSKTLAQTHALLPQHCFYRAHKSYVINLYCVKNYDDMYITLINGTRIDLARKKTGEFKRIYSTFVHDYYVRT